jgi:activating signal cointegrator 1
MQNLSQREEKKKMKALSLSQPWATFLAIGAKRIETRSWSTKFRGRFAIHAAKGFPGWAKDMCEFDPHFIRVLKAIGINTRKELEQLPRGQIIGTGELVHCLSTNGAYLNFSMGNFEMKNSRVVASEVQAVNYQKPQEGTAEFAFGDYSPNRFMYFVENPLLLDEPISCSGALGFWEVPKEITERYFSK